MTGARLRAGLLLAGAGLYALMWAGGIVAYVVRGGPRPHEAWTAPAFLALGAALVLGTSTGRNAAWLLVILALGYLSELIAVTCDCVFGAYHYTEALSPRLLGVPIVMSAAWTILIAYVKEVVPARRWPVVVEVLLASAWMTAIDLIIDPLAAGPLGYWRWRDPGAYYGIPASNFAGWFLVSAVMFAVLRAGPRAWAPNPWAERLGLSVILFFTLIALSLGLWLAAFAGAVLVGLHVVVRRSAWRAAAWPAV